MAAKNSASEKALRDIIIQKMIQSPRSTPAKPNAEAQPAGQGIALKTIELRFHCFCFIFNSFIDYLRLLYLKFILI